MSVNLLYRAGALGLLLSISSVAIPAQTTARPRPKIVSPAQAATQYSYQYGYKAGYDDGYVKGQSDFNDSRSRDIEGSTAYSSADRGYQESYGTRAEYQEAYRIGFEMAYNDGYFGRPRTSTLPTNLGRVVVATVNANSPAQTAGNSASNEDTSSINTSSSSGSSSSSSRARTTGSDDSRRASDSDDRDDRDRRSSSRGGGVVIADGVQMKVRLMNEISTKVNQQGDKFSAVVLDPSDYAEAEVFGHIGKLNRSGKATGKTELALVFDSIRLRDGRTGRLAAQVEKVYESESVKEVDEEGNVQTGSRTKDTAVRGVGGAALGAIIGGIAGGGKGAAIGAILGGGVGAGSVYVQDGKDLVMSPGTELLIRTASPAR